MNIVEKARTFATAAHSAVGQVRKYTGEPYINHPAEVVGLLEAFSITQPEMLAAAWLHDVVEDTSVGIDLIEKEFGRCIADLVSGLTDVSRPEDGNRARRKAIDRKHSAAQSPACQTIKLADLICNTESIISRDPEFAVVYLAEKRELLAVMDKGDVNLYGFALRLASDA